MPDEFGDVLDRMDIHFTDLNIAGSAADRLRAVLGGAASREQIRIASERLVPEQAEAERLGFVGSRRMLRRGPELVLQPVLAEIATGRIVRLGIERIREFLRERGGQV